MYPTLCLEVTVTLGFKEKVGKGLVRTERPSEGWRWGGGKMMGKLRAKRGQ